MHAIKRSKPWLCWMRRAWPANAAQDEAERQRENLTDQIERAAKHARHDEGPAEGTELRRDAEGEPLRLALAAKRLPPREAPAERAAAPAFEAAERDDKVPGTVACIFFADWLCLFVVVRTACWGWCVETFQHRLEPEMTTLALLARLGCSRVVS